ncbi:MAG: fibrobacter succinogenes major paralogous domain-containing protein [Dysgonamonadaceae bacterium]|jgi:uncharacterized protein (TIGR02145 family)|nr:fibrobacter succinogenes major paralogous domain-containing protein [Dysgonamonadaceae bacterium]
MTKKTIFLLLLFLMVLGTVNVNAQVRIGGSTAPHESAILDLNFDSGIDTLGLLLPRVHLDNVSSSAPLPSPEKGLVVYNLTIGNGLNEGIYYNDGSGWHPVLSSVAPVGGLELPIIFLRQPGKVWLGDTGSLIDTMYVELLEKTSATTFQWYRRDPDVSPVLLNGETSDTLFINTGKSDLKLTAPGKASQFFCVVRNGSQTAVSGSGYAVYGPGAWLANGKWINIAPANLGADQTKTVAWQMAHVPVGSAPTSNPLYEDSVYGDWYQWGRKKDGHQSRNVLVADVANNTYLNSPEGVPVNDLNNDGQILNDKTGYGKFIQRNTGDWRDYPGSDNTITSPANAWTWANTVNDPCKDPSSSLPSDHAWRVPSQSEWTQIRQNNTWSWYGSSTSGYEIKPGGAAKSTSLFLPLTGLRGSSSGQVGNMSYGYYWSSSPTSINTFVLNFDNTMINTVANYSRSYGFAVRCVADY